MRILRARCVVGILLLTALSGCTSTDFAPQREEEGKDAALARVEALLTRQPYPDLVVEIRHPSSHAPSSFALSAFESMLVQVVDKRTIDIPAPVLLPAWADTSRVWTQADLIRLAEDSNSQGLRFHEHGINSTAILQIFFMDGQYEESVLGLHVRGRIFLFLQSDPGWMTVGPYRERVERATLIHEAGHAMGLVNCGIPMVKPHEASNSPCHSSNDRSVMSAGFHLRTDLNSLLRDEWLPYEFDENDLADLRAFQSTRTGEGET